MGMKRFFGHLMLFMYNDHVLSDQGYISNQLNTTFKAQYLAKLSEKMDKSHEDLA